MARSFRWAEVSRVERRLLVRGQGVSFAGSRANASNLVIGLRRGTPIALTAAPGNGQDAAPISFTPPIRALGNSAVYISLALAKQQLANLGISQPTPEQIKAALIGGTVSSSGAVTRTATLPGVLTLRSQGMSWAAIAKSRGVRLGAVVNGMQGANHDLIALHLHYVALKAHFKYQPVTGYEPAAGDAGYVKSMRLMMSESRNAPISIPMAPCC